MSIGKPLLVTERQGVARINPLQPVLSPQTRQLSSDVPVQKIALADYSIGMQNVKASFAVSDELINMVDAGIKAKVYHDNAVKDRKRLTLMEDWQNSDRQYLQDFAQAQTFEEQQEVISSYDAMQDKLTVSWQQEMGDDLDSAKYLSSLRNGSRKQYSKFSTTSYQTLHKDTVALHNTNMERTAQELSENKNSDYVSGIKSIQDSMTSLVSLGAESAESAALKLHLTTDKILTQRSTLFAQDYATNILATGQDFPSEEQLTSHLSTVTGVKLSPRQIALAKESFNDAFYKEMKEYNAYEDAEEKYVTRQLLIKKTKFEAETDSYLLDLAGGIPSTDYIKQRVKAAKSFDTSLNPGYSTALETKLNKLRWGTSSPTQLELYTTGAGRKLFPEAYHDLKEAEKRLRGLQDQNLNEKTILDIVQYLRVENDKVINGLGNESQKTIDNVLNSLRHDETIFDLKFMDDDVWNKFYLTGMTMEKVFAHDLQLGLAYRAVRGRLAEDRNSKPPKGPFSQENMALPVGDRLKILTETAEQYIKEEFGGVLAAKKQKLVDKASEQELANVQKSRLPKAAKNKFVPESQTESGTSAPATKDVLPTTEQVKTRHKKAALKFKQQIEEGELTNALLTAGTSTLQDAAETKVTKTLKPIVGLGTLIYQARSSWLKNIVEPTESDLKKLGGLFGNIDGVKKDIENIANAFKQVTPEMLLNDLSTLTSQVGLSMIQGGAETTAQESTMPPTTNTVESEVPEMLPQPVTTPIIPPEIVEAATPIIQTLANQIAPKPANAIADVPDVPVIDPLDPNYDIDADLKQRFEAIERSTARHKRSIKLSQRAGWPKGGTPESDAIERQLDKEFPDTIQSVGKGLSEPIDAEMTFTQAPSGEERANWQARHRADIAAFIANKYNASKKQQQVEYAEHATEGLKKYHDGKLNKRQQINLTSLLATLNKAKSSFSGDLKYIGMPYEEFLDHMIGIYSAETNFGTSKSKVSETDVVGELQVTRGSFRDVVKPDGNFGKLMAKAAGFTIQELRQLADKKNDKKLRTLLLNNKKLNYLAGAAILLSKLQYQ